MKEEKLRRSFLKIRQEMNQLNQDIQEIKQYLWDLNEYLSNPAHQQHSSTQTQKIEGIKAQIPISIGNHGVPADSQQTFDTSKIAQIQGNQEENLEQTTKKLTLKQIKNIVENLTTELKLKFKSLSKQEFFIFSMIYNLDMQGQKPDYKSIAIRANLTESSVRDYISRLIHKGIPLKKEKINNKQVIISVPDELKNIATLDNLTKISQYNNENDNNMAP